MSEGPTVMVERDFVHEAGIDVAVPGFIGQTGRGCEVDGKGRDCIEMGGPAVLVEELVTAGRRDEMAATPAIGVADAVFVSRVDGERAKGETEPSRRVLRMRRWVVARRQRTSFSMTGQSSTCSSSGAKTSSSGSTSGFSRRSS